MERIYSDSGGTKTLYSSSNLKTDLGQKHDNTNDMDTSISIKTLAQSIQAHLISGSSEASGSSGSEILDGNSIYPYSKREKPPLPKAGNLKMNTAKNVSPRFNSVPGDKKKEPFEASTDTVASKQHLPLPDSDMNGNEFKEIEVFTTGRLKSPFYDQLRKKYPKAFRRRTSVGSLYSDTDSVSGDATPSDSQKQHAIDQNVDSPHKVVRDLTTSPNNTKVKSRMPYNTLHGVTKIGSQYSSCSSIQSENLNSKSESLHRSDSVLSLKERLQQNQDSFKQLLHEGPLGQRRGLAKGRGQGGARKMTAAISSPDLFSKHLSVSSGGEKNQITSQKPPVNVLSKPSTPCRRLSSPVSSTDSAVDLDSTSHQSSPVNRNHNSYNDDTASSQQRASRQRTRTNAATAERGPRSRTPKLKSARVKESVSSTGGNSGLLKKHNSVESDGDSGIVNRLTEPLHLSLPREDDEACVSGQAPADVPSPQLSSSSSSSHPIISHPLQTQPHSPASLSSQTADSAVILPSNSDQFSVNDNLSAAVIQSKKPPLSSKKPPTPQNKSKNLSPSKLKAKQHRNSPDTKSLSASELELSQELSTYTPKKEKKSILPWKRNRGRYTPSEEIEKMQQVQSKNRRGSLGSLKSLSISNPIPVGSIIPVAPGGGSGYDDVDDIGSRNDDDDEDIENPYETVTVTDTGHVTTKPPRASSSKNTASHSKTTDVSPAKTSDNGMDTYAKVDLSKKPPKASKHNPGKRRSTMSDITDADTEPPVPVKHMDSNLTTTEAGSCTSLSEKSGSLRDSVRKKFGKLRRAVSLERVDKEEAQSTSDSAEAPAKLKKSPSLRSLTDLFRGKKSKEERKTEEKEKSVDEPDLSVDHVSVRKPPKAPQGSVRSSGRGKRASILVSDSVETPQHFRPIGKLKTVNPDGTQVLQMNRPVNGHGGFYIARGNAKFKHGIFVSRLSEALPEHFMAGLISVGDEILEVNGRKVTELPLEAVYDLMGQGHDLILKTLPFSVRKEENLI